MQLLGPDGETFVTVPKHSEIDKSTVDSIIKQSKIEREVFLKLL